VDNVVSGRGVTPRLPSLSSRQVISALKDAGFVDAPRRGKGSHRALVLHGERARLVIVPDRKDIPIGTLRSIIRQAGMTPDEFLSHLA